MDSYEVMVEASAENCCEVYYRELFDDEDEARKDFHRIAKEVRDGLWGEHRTAWLNIIRDGEYFASEYVVEG